VVHEFKQRGDCFDAVYAYPVSGICELIGMPLASNDAALSQDAAGVVSQPIKGRPSDRAGEKAKRFSGPAIIVNAIRSVRFFGAHRQCRWS
jgi:hypothetical protein